MATYYDPPGAFQAQYASLGLIGISFGNGSEVIPTRLDFNAGTSQNNINTVTTAAQSWDWKRLVMPNPVKFVSDVTADSSLTGILSLIMPYYAAISNYALAPAAVKAAWAQLKTAYSSQLTSPIVSTIETYASQSNMSLT